MKRTVASLILIGIMGLLNGCMTEQREYFRIANGGTGNLEVDKAQCQYQAELNTQMPNRTNITVNVDNRQGYGSTNYSNVYDEKSGFSGIGTRFRENQALRDQDDKVNRLTDLCLKSRGWSWKVIN